MSEKEDIFAGFAGFRRFSHRLATRRLRCFRLFPWQFPICRQRCAGGAVKGRPRRETGFFSGNPDELFLSGQTGASGSGQAVSFLSGGARPVSFFCAVSAGPACFSGIALAFLQGSATRDVSAGRFFACHCWRQDRYRGKPGAMPVLALAAGTAGSFRQRGDPFRHRLPRNRPAGSQRGFSGRGKAGLTRFFPLSVFRFPRKGDVSPFSPAGGAHSGKSVRSAFCCQRDCPKKGKTTGTGNLRSHVTVRFAAAATCVPEPASPGKNGMPTRNFRDGRKAATDQALSSRCRRTRRPALFFTRKRQQPDTKAGTKACFSGRSCCTIPLSPFGFPALRRLFSAE
ncbi:hypothetical protein OFAG_02250 [Oxalobacter formigenes HOxBLS]|uniref:Uncharacterized protein n=1 Tax=Oxalobacter paraformigenes TaxID=556268 RepID=T5LSX4_9BURK|nr:hypothetical protein OFAG_02250 [Oxalobacter paraformigenes]